MLPVFQSTAHFAKIIEQNKNLTVKGSTEMRSTIRTIHTIQTQTEFRPGQHCCCHLNKEFNLNQSKDDSFVERVATNNT